MLFVFYVILLIVALLFIMAALISSLFYWYEAVNTPCPEIPAPKPGVLVCAKVFLFCLSGYVLAVVMVPLGYVLKFHPDPARPEALKLPPVVLVHGLNDTAGNMLLLYYRLRKKGFRVFIFSYNSLFRPLGEVRSLRDDFIFQVEKSCTSHKPILIGHSLGGLLIRDWLQKEGNSQRVAGVVTLGTPHQGSKLAFAVPGFMAAEVRPGSNLIEGLSAGAPVKDLRCSSLASPTDEAVLPAASLVPPEGWNLRVTTPVSHFQMVLSGKVFEQILHELSYMDAGCFSYRRTE